MNLSALFKEYLNKQTNPPSGITIKNYISDVNRFIRWFEAKFNSEFIPSEITPSLLEQFKSESLQNYSASSVDRSASSLRKFFSFLKLEGQISHSPFEVKEERRENDDPWKIRDFKNHLYVFGASHLTIKNYIIDAKQFLTWVDLVVKNNKDWDLINISTFSKINPQLIEEYKNRLLNEAHLSPISVNRKLSSIRRFIYWAIQEGLINNDSGFENISNSQINQIINTNSETNDINTHQNDSEELNSNDYSKIPPVRLAQKLKIGLIGIIDSLITAPVAQALEKTDSLVWNIKGNPVFKEKVNLENKIPVPSIIDPKKINNIPKSFYSPTTLSTASFPLHKKILHHARNSRPKWYKTYHSYAFASYLHFSILMLFISIMGYFIFQTFSPTKEQPRTLAALPSSPPRILSFQGRLTDSSDSPITKKTNLRMSIYNSPTSSGSALLWQEVVSPTPDSEGIFSIILGSSTPIPQSLFAQNSGLWLGVTVEGTEELKPRQQLATVAYASNSETLQGLPPITNTTSTSNVVLALNSSGNLTIGGTASPTFQATGGTFTLLGKTLVLTTSSNGSIKLSPNGIGVIDIQKSIQNTSNNGTLVPGSVTIEDLFSVIATSSGQAVLNISQGSSGDLVMASTSGNLRFRIDNAGNLFANGTINGLSVNSGTIDSGTWHGVEIGAPYGGTGQTSYTTGDMLYASDSTVISKLGIGSNGSCLTSNGVVPTWISCVTASNGGGLWNQSAGVLFPTNSTVDFLIGGQSTESARFALTNINGTRGSQVASLSGSITLDSSTATIQTTNNQDLNLGGNTTGLINIRNNAGSIFTTFDTVNSRIGLGTTNPGFNFDLVNNSGDAAIRLKDSTNNLEGIITTGGSTLDFGSLTNHPIVLYTNNDSKLRLSANGGLSLGTIYSETDANSNDLLVEGNVGIGTTSPTAKLDVNGTASISGGLTVYGTANIQSSEFKTLIFGGDTTGNLNLEAGSSANSGYVLIGSAGQGGVTNPDFLVIDQASGALPTPVNGALAMDSTGKFNIYENGQWKVLCNKTDETCGTGSGSSLSAITLATGGNTINNGDNAQAWNWSISTNSKAAFTFGENSASTGSNSTILKVSTIANSSASPFQVDARGSSAFSIGNTGLIGINTTSPLASLDLRSRSGTLPTASISGSSSAAGLLIDQSGSGDIFAASKGGTTRFVITNGGNIGIGSTTPSSSLYVTRPLSFRANGKALAIFDQLESGQDIITASLSGETMFSVRGNNTNAGIELGQIGTSTTPYFDFHSGATATDYDARIVASGGTGVSGGGTLQITSGGLTLAGQSTVTATSLTTFTTAATLGMTSTTTLNLGNNATLSSNATALNLEEDGGVDVNIAGTSSGTGCTITNLNGNFACAGTSTFATDETINGIDIDSGAISDVSTLTLGSSLYSSSDHISVLDNKTNDTTYEWFGFYSGSTRQGIILYDGAWAGCANSATDFCVVAENSNRLVLQSGTTEVYVNDSLTTVGDLNVDGTSNDIAGTLNLSGNTLTSSGDLTINPTGGDIIFGDGDTIALGGVAAGLAYNAISDSGGATDHGLASDDDLFIEGDLETNGVLYADGGIDTAFTAGSLVFAGTNGLLTQDNSNLFWDDTDNNLGIGTTSTPSESNLVLGSHSTTEGGQIQLNPGSSGSVAYFLDVFNDSLRFLTGNTGASSSTIGQLTSSTFTLNTQTTITASSLANFTTASTLTFSGDIGVSGGDIIGTTANIDLGEALANRINLSADNPGGYFVLGSNINSILEADSDLEINNYGASNTIRKTYITNSGTTNGIRFGINISNPQGMFHVSGDAAGKALAILNQTGTTDILSASVSGESKFRITNTGSVITENNLYVESGFISLSSGGWEYGLQNNISGSGCAADTICWTKIGDASPDKMSLTNNGNLVTRGTMTASSNPDIAETINIDDQSIESGDIVSSNSYNPDAENPYYKAVASKSSTEYQPSMIGIISEDPSFLIRTKSSKPISDKWEENERPMVIAGRIPVKITTANGNIRAGDPITSSNIPGVGMKATKAGRIIGIALQDYSNSDTSNVGKVLVLLNPTWQDPDVQIADSGYLSLAPTINNDFEVKRQTGETISRIGAFSDLVVAKIKAGYLEVGKITTETLLSASANISELSTDSLAISTENVTIAGQTLRNYIASIVEDVVSQNEDTIIVAPILSTDVISPKTGNNLAIKLRTNDKNSKLEIQNASGSAVASIDAEGNASFSGQILASNVNANDASFSGTLRAGRIIADNIEGLNINASTISANYITNNYYYSTPSGSENTSYLANNPTSSGSGSFNNLFAMRATFEQGLMAYGPASFYEASVADRLFVGSRLSLADSSINVLGGDLELQSLKQGGIAFVGGEVKIDTDGNLRVNGNAYFAKDLEIKGDLFASLLSPLPGRDFVIKLGKRDENESENHDSSFVIKDASSSALLSVNNKGDLNASGAGTFNKLNISLVNKALALSPTEVVATGSAGTAEISPNREELTIRNSLVTKDSLIYITAKTSTSNESVYLLRQVPGESFTVGISSPINKKVPFNWIIIN